MASTTVEIARPPEEVFAFVTDPAKLSAWQDAEEVQQLTEGPVRAGRSSVRFTRSWAGGGSN